MLLPLMILLALIAAFLAYVATRPGEFTVQRSATMNAPAERVFAILNDFRSWTVWSPWEKLDPELKRTYGGNASGRGSTYEWAGNKKAGQGRMEITEATPPSRLVIKLDFLKPFESHNTTEFRIEPSGSVTQVTWTMRGASPFMAKLMGVFVSMDKMVGRDFEAGLANMKAVVEKG